VKGNIESANPKTPMNPKKNTSSTLKNSSEIKKDVHIMAIKLDYEPKTTKNLDYIAKAYLRPPKPF